MRKRAWVAMAGAALAGGAAAGGDERIVEITISEPADLSRLSAMGVELLACEPGTGRQAAMAPADAVGVLAELGMAPIVLDADPEGTFAAERTRALGALARGDDADWWADYKPYDAVLAKMEEMRARRPDLVEIFEFGDSYEGRPLMAMRITGPRGAGDPCRPAVLLHSVIHAREWITVMVNMWVAESLIAGHGVDPYISHLVDSVEWVIVPVLNPDGYVFSWTDYRMWRKNRNPSYTEPGRRIGVDLNRNFSVGWGSNVGSSSTPHADTYRGPEPFSEPETRALRGLAIATPNLRAHNDMHSYSELVLFPQGYTAELSPDHKMFDQLAAEMRQRIAAYRGRSYRVGPIFTAIYPVSGGTVDWFYSDRGAWSFSYELCCTTFNPPPTQIRLNAEETLPATLLLGEFVGETYRFRADFNRDCRHDFFDIMAYLDAYVAGDPLADTDGSGTLSPTDVTDFIALFVERR